MSQPRIPLACTWVLCVLSAVAQAQDKSVAPSADTQLAAPQQQEPEGTPPLPGPAPSRAIRPMQTVQSAETGTKPFEVGSFLFYPEIVANWMYDSNVFYTNRAIGDHAMVFSPAFWLQSNWTQHALNFYASSDITQYANYSTENTADWRASVEGRYDLNADTNVYGGYRRGKEHQDRESPDNRNGIKPTIYYLDRAYAGFFKQIDRFSVRIGGTWLHLNYDDVAFLPGSGSGIPRLINNDDRDRSQYTGGIRLGYELSPRVEPYVQIALDNRRYTYTPDDNGYYRNSDGMRYLAGVRWNLPKKLKLDAFAGYMSQKYTDPRLQPVSTPAFGAALLWAPITDLKISGYLDRTIEETTLAQTVDPTAVPPTTIAASSYTNTYASLGANYRLTGRLVVQGNISYSQAKYNGMPRTDDYYGFGGGLVYQVDKSVYVDISYAYRNLHSSVPTENFIKRQTFIGLAFPLSM